MGPLWSGQGTVPHCTVSDLLSTDVLVSPSGAPAGAAAGRRNLSIIFSLHVPCVVVLTVEETVLLIPIPSYTATTLIVQLLPGGREEILVATTVTDS